MFFGTDGIRGHFGAGLVATAYRLGQVLEGYVLVAEDNRPSSPQLAAALLAGLKKGAARVIYLGVLPTPVLSFLVRAWGADWGVMITASHNPSVDNGLKLITADGEKPTEKKQKGLEKEMEKKDGLPGKIPAPCPTADAAKRGMHAYLESLPTENLRGLRVAVDCANGAAYSLVKQAFLSRGATVRCVAHGKGNRINAGCGALYPAYVHSQMQGDDIAFALDGDGDRCVGVLPSGRILDGDCILYLLALHWKRQGLLWQSTVVGTELANGALEGALGAHGIGIERVNVGDANVWERMKEKGYVLGAEPSGHVLMHSAISCGTRTALAVAGIYGEIEKDLQGYSPLPQVRRDLPLGEKDVEKLCVYAEDERVIEEALSRHLGQRIEVERGKVCKAHPCRVLLRPSGTQPLVRVMVEHDDPLFATHLANKLASALSVGK